VAAVDTSQVQSEYRALIERCGLVDRGERGKLALTGSGAVEFLNGQVTNELADLHPGEGRYAAFLTHKGKMLGDVRILAIADEPIEGPDEQESDQPPTELLLDTERVALQALFDMIRRFKVGYAVELHKRTLESALLSLEGPRSREVLDRALDAPLVLAEVEHTHRLVSLAERRVRIVATAHAGVDVICAADDRDAVCEVLQSAGAEPVSEPTAEIVRVERGRPRYGVDIDESTIPQEAALNERAVSFTKGCYVGQETVARLFYRGKPNRHLRGLLLGENPDRNLDEIASQIPTGAELRLGERSLGHLSSVVHSPRLGTIGLALVRREAEPGAIVSVGEQGAQARLVDLPFETPDAT
jgi:tRNA-modifying protein YgfZ